MKTIRVGYGGSKQYREGWERTFGKKFLRKMKLINDMIQNDPRRKTMLVDIVEPKERTFGKKQIKRNRVKCLACGKVLESKYTHDFQICGCSNVTFVDGGHSYRRVGGVDLSKVQTMKDDE